MVGEDVAGLPFITRLAWLIDAFVFETGCRSREGYQSKVGREPAARRGKTVHGVLRSYAIALKQEKFVERIPGSAVQQERNQKRACELCVCQPDGIERIASFDGKYIDKDRLGTAKQDVAGGGILESTAFFEESRAEFKGELRGCVEHGGRPFVRIAGEGNAGVFDDYFVRAAGAWGIEHAGGDESAFLHKGVGDSGVQAGVEVTCSCGENGADYAIFGY